MEEGLVCLTIFLASGSLAGKISEEKSEKVVGAEGKNIILEQWIEGEISMDTWKTWYSFEGETWHSFEGECQAYPLPWRKMMRWKEKSLYIHYYTTIFNNQYLYLIIHI